MFSVIVFILVLVLAWIASLFFSTYGIKKDPIPLTDEQQVILEARFFFHDLPQNAKGKLYFGEKSQKLDYLLELRSNLAQPNDSSWVKHPKFEETVLKVAEDYHLSRDRGYRPEDITDPGYPKNFYGMNLPYEHEYRYWNEGYGG